MGQICPNGIELLDEFVPKYALVLRCNILEHIRPDGIVRVIPQSHSENQLFESLEDITSALGENKCVGVAYLDLSKTFGLTPFLM